MKVYDIYLNNLKEMRNEQLAAAKTMRQLPEATFDKLNAEAEKATFTRRNYNGQFYCWLHHSAITASLDPWPASRYPKAVVCIEIARAIEYAL